jgi:energy-coupling factor transporter ATP-binding protein EcfA2
VTAVALRGVQVERGGTRILRDVDLDLPAGEFCVFVGPSGCGKSTLLRDQQRPMMAAAVPHRLPRMPLGRGRSRNEPGETAPPQSADAS